MPSLVKLYNEFKESDFVILAVDIREKKKIVKKFVEKQKMPFPVLLDKDGRVATSYGIRAHPTHFLINGKGEMIGVAQGARDWASVESRNLIRFLLAQNKKDNGEKKISRGDNSFINNVASSTKKGDSTQIY